MKQILTLYSNDKQLIRTTSPDIIMNIDDGKYTVDENLKHQLSELWQMEEYTGDLILEVTNG
jgi:hypothetical protein